MAARSSAPTCVFCGRDIGPDEPSSGRPPMAAHAACADAALADDRHWDAVASHEADDEAQPEGHEAGANDDSAAPPKRQGGRAGCLTVVVILGLGVVVQLSRRFRR